MKRYSRYAPQSARKPIVKAVPQRKPGIDQVNLLILAFVLFCLTVVTLQAHAGAQNHATRAEADRIKEREVQTVTARVRWEGFTPAYEASAVYPPKALKQGIEGFVAVQFDIDREGSVQNPRVLESDPAEWFDQAAMNAIRQFRFSPLRIDGKGTAITGVVSKFVFELYRNKSHYGYHTELVSL